MVVDQQLLDLPSLGRTPVSATPPLGRLERVELRQAWLSEATDFTPWLARPENITLLGEAIGVDLDVQGTEQYVGPFRADVFCKDMRTDTNVLIENQLERTDHTHLGQLLTYAAGLKAVIIVWVAAKFTDEHRAALDWLNEITPSEVGFFGLEVELWRIGDSPPAPKFNVVSQPNEWSKAAAGIDAAAITETQALHLEFWTQLKRYMEQRASPVRIQVAAKNPIQISLGRSGFGLRVANLGSNHVSEVWLLLSGPNAKAHYHLIKDVHGHEVESALGSGVLWREQPDRSHSSIALRTRSDFRDRSTWPELTEWISTTVEAMSRLFRPMIQTLDASGYNPAVPETVDADPLLSGPGPTGIPVE
jgi:hypothetical protein